MMYFRKMATGLVCACLFLFGSCVDHSDNPVPNAAYMHYADSLQNKLASGTWIYDLDGIPDVDVAAMAYTFDGNDKLSTQMYFYDLESKNYTVIDYDLHYEVLPRQTLNGVCYDRLALSLSDEQLKELAGEMDAEMLEAFKEEIVDTMLLGVTDKCLSIPVDTDKLSQEELDLLEEEEFDAVTDFYHGSFDHDAATVEELLNQIAAEEETAAASRGNRRSTSFSGRPLDSWMSQIHDSTKVCKMCLPGAHDSGTGHMKDEWMLSLGMTQLFTIEQQFSYGCRVFDLRTRYTQGYELINDDAPWANWIYHGFLNCDVRLNDALNQIVACLKEHPTEGVIVEIQCEDKGVSLPSKLEFLTNNVAPLNFNFTDLDAEKTMSAAMLYIRWKLHEQGLLAKFSPDMTMADLRGKVLVMLNDNVPGVHYLGLDDYLCMWAGGQFRSVSGNKVGVMKQQNIYEPDGNTSESDEAYSARKTKAFEEMCAYTEQHPDDIYWVNNAANGYFREWKAIPDYATMAHYNYSSFINSLATHEHNRGIFLQDYIGCESPFKRVPVWGLIPGGITGIFGKFLNLMVSRDSRDIDIQAFRLFYHGSKLLSKSKNTRGQELCEMVIESNFGKVTRQGDPTKLYDIPGGDITTEQEGYKYLFDGNSATKWCVKARSKTNGCWTAYFRSEVPGKAKSYTMTTGFDSGKYWERNPKSWRLYGRYYLSESWHPIDARETADQGVVQLPHASNASVTYDIKDPKLYEYYKLEVYAPWDSSWLPDLVANVWMQLGEFQLNY